MIAYDLLTAAFDTFSWMPSVHGGGGDAGLVGLVDTVVEKLSHLVESGAAFTLFPGIRALALNVHPMIVHFPVAFLTAFFLLETIGLIGRRPALRVAASWMLYLGAFGAVAAVAAGLAAAATVPHGALVHETMEWHERLMLTVAGLALALAVWRAMVSGVFNTSMAQGLHLFLATVMISLMVIGTDLGGLMVYRHGVGVATLQSAGDSDRHVHAEVRNREEPEAVAGLRPPASPVGQRR